MPDTGGQITERQVSGHSDRSVTRASTGCNPVTAPRVDLGMDGSASLRPENNNRSLQIYADDRSQVDSCIMQVGAGSERPFVFDSALTRRRVYWALVVASFVASVKLLYIGPG